MFEIHSMHEYQMLKRKIVLAMLVPMLLLIVIGMAVTFWP